MVKSDPDHKGLESRISDVLTPLQARVFRLRFGGQGRSAHSIREVAAILDLDEHQVGEIEEEALRKLRTGPKC